MTIFPPYHHERAVEVQTLAAALGQHEPAAAFAVVQHGGDEQHQVEQNVAAQEQELPAVVLPVGPGQVPGRLRLLLLLIRRFQPVSGAVDDSC